ncbi:MAG: hypothetical protein WCF67_12555 [Chitinophagaceae bacterium]
MTDALNSYDSYVVRSILANNEFNISEVRDLLSLKTRYFVQEEYAEIERMVLNKDIEAIKSLPDNKAEFGEYLDIVFFRDQENKQYIATVYDSIELTQDPQIIKLYGL